MSGVESDQAFTSSGPGEPLALQVVGLTKTFGGVVAIDDVSLTARAGEITALVGNNGAGKSTLMKCVAGVHEPDSGEIRVDGGVQRFVGPFAARAAGIEAVYQELALAENLDVAANIFLGREEDRGWLRGMALRKREMRTRATAMLESFGVHVPSIQTEIRNLSGGQRQGVAIARAVGWGTRIIVMDEPTAALGVRETQRVQETILQLAEQRLAVLLVSHNLEQVFQVSDHVWILRRGRLVAGLRTSETNPEEVVRYITGLATQSA